MKNNKRKIAIIILSILGILDLVALITCIVIQAIIIPDTEEKPTIKPNEEGYVIELFKNTSGYLCEEIHEYCNIKFGEIPTNTPNAIILGSESYEGQNNPKYILYYDDKMYLYNFEEKTKQEINLEYYADKDISYSFISEKEEATAIIYTLNVTEENLEKISGYYDIKTKKTSFKNEYYSLYPTKHKEYILGAIYNVGKEEYDGDFVDYVEFIEIKTGNKHFKTDNMTPECVELDKKSFSNKDYYLVYQGCVGEIEYEVYDPNKEKIGSDDAEFWYIKDDGYGYYLENNTVYTYNFKTSTKETLGNYNDVIDIIYGYVLYINENNEVMLTDGNEEYKIHEWQKNNYYHAMLSDYYEEGNVSEEGKKAGIYMIFEYNSSSEGPGVEYYFDPKTKEIEKYELEEIGGYAKPVLYLYPEKTTKVTVNFEKEENLTTTYPKFNNQWEVTVSPNGDMYDKDGKYYYGLYWEEDQNHKVDFKEGFYVTKDNAIEFLEEKLTYIGLNDKERNEFIMYWLPIIEKNEHNLIYFELTEERDSFNELQISPKPNSILRMAIHVKKVNGPQKIKEQKLTKFERKGFVAVEWGGIAYN